MPNATFAKLDSGKWGVRVTGELNSRKEGDRVEVERKDGSTSMVTLQTVMESGDDYTLWAVVGDRDDRPRKSSGSGGFKRSPAETSAIQRQHSQEMGLRREQNMVAAGHRPYTGEQLRSVINWFEEDIKGKDRAIIWDGYGDDVPVDETDLQIK